MDPWDVLTFQSDLSPPPSVWAVEDGGTVASLVWSPSDGYDFEGDSYDQGEIISVYVDPSWQRNGLATHLLDMARHMVSYPVVHSDVLSADGLAWSEKVGSHVCAEFSYADEQAAWRASGASATMSYLSTDEAQRFATKLMGEHVYVIPFDNDWWGSAHEQTAAGAIWKTLKDHPEWGPLPCIAVRQADRLSKLLIAHEVAHLKTSTEEDTNGHNKAWFDAYLKMVRTFDRSTADELANRITAEKKMALTGTWWRVHPRDRSWTDNLTSTPFFHYPGWKTQEGLSCFGNPWFLWSYYGSYYWTPQSFSGQASDIVSFSGQHVGTGNDGEDLVVPDGPHQTYSLDQFIALLLRTPIPPRPPDIPGMPDSWKVFCQKDPYHDDESPPMAKLRAEETTTLPRRFDKNASGVDDYGGLHRPMKGPPIFDLLLDEGEGAMLPDDVYDHPSYYTGFTESQFLAETMRVLNAVRGKPNAMVTIYRGAPESASTINTGDWVTLSRQYAVQHGYGGDDHQGDDDWPVHAASVSASTVRFAGDDLMEYGYWGPPTSARTAASWRPFVADDYWNDHDVTISSEGGGSGRRAYEVHVHGKPFATRPTLTEAKAAVEDKYGSLQWRSVRMDKMVTPDVHWGDVDWYTSPTTIWVADL